MNRLLLPSLALFAAGLLAPTVRPAATEKSGLPDVVQAEHSAIGVTDSATGQHSHTAAPGAQWYPDAGLGIFFHWGISSVRAINISWPMITGRILATQRISDPNERERIIREQDYNLTGRPPPITPNQYWAMAAQFNPRDYQPELWLKAAHAAGFQYAVLTAKHHEGFALWPSAFGDFSTKNFLGGRDLIRPYVEACRKYGLKVGLYYSPPDWHFDRDYMNFLSRGTAAALNPELPSLDADLRPRRTTPDPEAVARHQAAFAAYIRGQVEELLTRYGKIDLIWFDGKPGFPHGDEAISLARIRELQPQILINPRLTGHGDFVTYERRLPAQRPTVGWAELCNTWTDGWPYMEDPDTHRELPYRANGHVLGELALCRSWGINYLLDLGPKADGTLSSEAYRNLAEVAQWMKINAAAVIGAKPLPPGESANVPATIQGAVRYLFAIPKFKAGGALAQKVSAIAAAAAIPATAVGEYPDEQLPPKDETLCLSGVRRPRTVRLLGAGGPLEWAYAEGTVSVLIPASLRSKLVDVVEVAE